MEAKTDALYRELKFTQTKNGSINKIALTTPGNN